jgi:hypothetical protein
MQGAAVAAGLSLARNLAEGQETLPRAPAPQPRNLIFDPADIPRLQDTVRHPRFAAYWEGMKNADVKADRVFLRDELKLNNHVRDLLRARQILERSAFVYALTHDQNHLQVARDAIEKILAYKRWDYFLEGGEETIGLQRAPETTIAMVCALEWLADALSADLKKEIEQQVGEKGAPACYRTLYGMRYPDRVKGWGFDPESDYSYRFDLRRWPFILNATNLKVIPVAGLALAGCKLYDSHPQASRWVDLALQSARAYATMFGSDGSYDEGVGYWGYTCLHLTMCIEVLRRRLGIDQRTMIDFPGTSRFALGMSMPTLGRPKDCVNFGDAWNMGDISVAAWTAREQRNRLAQYVALSVGEVSSHFAIVWFDKTVEPVRPDATLLNTRFSNDWVVSRTGWGERDAVAALRSGGPTNHEHADRNSVIFAAHGERLFHDPYHAAYSYTDPLWILRQTSAHTAALVNGKCHQYHDGHEGTNASWAEAEVVRYAPLEGSLVVTSDATKAYRLVTPETDLVRRTLIFLKPDVLILLDHVRFVQKAGTVQLRFQVDNSDSKGSVTCDATGFMVHRPSATLHAFVDAVTRPVIHADVLPVSGEHGVFPFAEIATAEAMEHHVLTVCTAQEAGKQHGVLSVSKLGNVWGVHGTHNGQTITVSIDIGQDTPGVTL